MTGFVVAAAVFSALLAGLNRGALLYLITTEGALRAGPLLRAVASASLQLGLAAGLLAGARALGARLLAPAVGTEDRPSWRPILELALGLSSASLAVLALGLFGLFRASVLQAGAFSLCLLGAADRLRLRRPGAGRDWVPPSAWPAAAAGLLAYLLWNSIIRALAPPTDIDVLKYHLELPKLYLLRGKVEDIPWLVFSHWPQSMEMQYGFGLAFASEGAAALIHTGLCAALVLLTFDLAREESGLSAAVISCCLLAAQPVVIHQAGAALTDGALALFYLLSCACLWRRRVSGDSRWLRPAGMMAGCAAAVKFHGLILLLGLAAWPLFSRRKSGAAKDAAAFLGWAAVFAAPWYLKAWLLAGNPIWPFLPGVFGGHWGAASVAAWLSPRVAASAGFGWSLLGEGAVFLLVPAGAALAWALLRRERPSAMWALCFLPVPLYLLRFAGSASAWRYLLPFFAPLAMAAGWAIARLLAGGRWQRAAAACLLGTGLSGVAWATHNNALYPVLGLRSRLRPELTPREAYLSRALPGYDFLRAVSRLSSPGDRVLLVAENRGYYLDVDFMLGDPPEQGVIDFDSAAGPGELREMLARWGITGVAISYEDGWYGPTLRRLAPRTYALIDETARRYGDEVLRVGAGRLYSLRPFSASPRS